MTQHTHSQQIKQNPDTELVMELGIMIFKFILKNKGQDISKEEQKKDDLPYQTPELILKLQFNKIVSLETEAWMCIYLCY